MTAMLMAAFLSYTPVQTYTPVRGCVVVQVCDECPTPYGPRKCGCRMACLPGTEQ